MAREKHNAIIFVMGVSGSGKSSIGKMLAKELNYTFIEGDDHHPESNIIKMRSGIPLTDEDRLPWLKILHASALNHKALGCVIACSALKKEYRRILSESISENVKWIYLKGSYELIHSRMQKRLGHFMKEEMLQSQFDVLEEPKNALEINIKDTQEIILENIKNSI